MSPTVLFNSVQYAGFLYLMVLLYWVVPTRYRLFVLLLGSYAFYAVWSVGFLAILIAESVMAWWVGRSLATAKGRAPKLILGAAVTVSIGVLLGFKIATAAGGSGGLGGLINVFGTNSVARAALPVGISFYTFQTVGYMVDVYRKELEPRPLFEVLTFVAFFPHLLAGPISRGRRLFPQLEDRSTKINGVQWGEAFELILIGLFQKVVVADSIRPATTAVLARFASDSHSVGSVDLWVASVGSLLWIVMDFAGYSNIARGSAKLFGIELPYNFRQPLTRSRSFQDFWRRHHLTLMAWFRDYVYRPLHKRRATVRNELATIVVFVLSGLWHGLTTGWLLWGVSVGSMVVVEQRLRKRWRLADRTLRQRRLGAALELLLIAALFVLAGLWVMTSSLGVGYSAAGRLLFATGAGAIDRDQLVIVALGILALVLVDRRQVQMEHREGRADPVTLGRAMGFGAMVVALVVFSGTPPQQFLYFNF